MPYKIDIIGWMTPADLVRLEELTTRLKPNSTIVEIGSFCGKSAVVFAMTADPSTKIYCVDIFPEIWVNTNYKKDSIVPFTPSTPEVAVSDIFDQNTKDYKNIIKVVGSSPQIKLDVDNVDLFFLDATHRNPNDIQNLIYWIPRLSENAILAGHDYYLELPHMPHLHNVYPDLNLNVKILETLFNKKVTTNGAWGSTWHFNMDRKFSQNEIISHVQKFIPNIRDLVLLP